MKYLSYYESPSDRTPLNRVLLKELSISKADPAALAQYEKEHLIIVDIKSSDRFELHLLLLLLLLFFFFYLLSLASVVYRAVKVTQKRNDKLLTDLLGRHGEHQ